jgi:hypothetical protein
LIDEYLRPAPGRHDDIRDEDFHAAVLGDATGEGNITCASPPRPGLVFAIRLVR